MVGGRDFANGKSLVQDALIHFLKEHQGILRLPSLSPKLGQNYRAALGLT
ncbi:hypothetical protein Hsw_PA0009 (plasmid) [Hymenobacter swuensis DY53]|uniref:Uncharacterized protein n=1 Tax=Hymenobacter swuensis DY53 TaxID=1227739 RepID=W8EU96_9BACT|nr:hypothetical protein Hsw_PA0009 [Hymenobacter swuensis DY53]